MKIICPHCGFSREQKNIPQTPDHIIATCPQCACRFRFSIHDGVTKILPPRDIHSKNGDEEEDVRVMASNAYMREAQRFAREQEAAQATATRQSRRVPWEDAPGPDGWLTALWQTILRVMFQAPLFFRNLGPGTPMMRPLGFFLIICVFQSLVEWSWSQAMLGFLSQQSPNDPNLAKLMEIASPGGNVFLTLLIRSGLLVLQLCIFSLLMYLAYRLVARDRVTFPLVFQILAYSSAPWILCVIPAIGSIAGALWGVGCAAVGCKTALRLGWSQTAIGFLPIIFLILPMMGQMSGLLAQ